MANSELTGNTVYILLCTWVNDGLGGRYARAYATMEAAQEAMRKDFEIIKSEWLSCRPEFYDYVDLCKNSADIGCTGDWANNHCLWNVYPTMVKGGAE